MIKKMLCFLVGLLVLSLLNSCMDDVAASHCGDNRDCDTGYCDPIKKICAIEPEEVERCVDGSVRELKNICGPNSRGTVAQICRNERWENSGECVDDDICEINAVQYLNCDEVERKKKQVCEDGQWRDRSECVATCIDGKITSIPCGLNGRGSQNQICQGGIWEYDGVCNDPDLCKDGAQEEQSCDERQFQSRSCVAGSWESWGKCIDKCADGEIRVIGSCGFNGATDGEMIEQCIGYKWGTAFCNSWLIQWGSTGNEYPRDMVLDREGNIYITGASSTAPDGSFSNGAVDLLIMKFNPRGEMLWGKLWGSPQSDFGNRIALAPDGSIYVIGETYGVVVEGAVYRGGTDIIMAKFDADGIYQWGIQRGSFGYDYSGDIDIDTTGNIYITGSYQGKIDSDQIKEDDDLFVMKYSATGELQWELFREGISGSYDNGKSIKVISPERVVVTGGTGVGFIEPCIGVNDGFLIDLNTDDGAINWIKQWGEAGDIIDVQRVASGDHGELIVAGSRLLSDNESVPFIRKYSSSGEYIGELVDRHYGAGDETELFDVALNQQGEIFITGSTTGSRFISNYGERDIFFARYKLSDLSFINGKQWGTAGNDSGFGIVLSGDTVVITGEVNQLFHQSGLHGGGADLFLMKIPLQ